MVRRMVVLGLTLALVLGATLWSLAPPQTAPTKQPNANPAWVSREILALGISRPVFPDLEVDGGSTDSADEKLLLITLDDEGIVTFRPAGPIGPRHTYPFGSEDPGLQDDAIRALRGDLEAATRGPGAQHKDGASHYRAVIRADGQAKWKHVQWVVSAVSSPAVRIWKIRFSLRRAEAPLASQLAMPGEESPFGRIDIEQLLSGSMRQRGWDDGLNFRVFRRGGSDNSKTRTLIEVKGHERVFDLPRAWEARVQGESAGIAEHDSGVDGTLQTALREWVEEAGGPGTVSAWIMRPPPKDGWVPHADMMRLAQLLRRAGIKDFLFDNAAPPLTPEERAERNKRR